MENYRLIIWDLDETFWRGTLSEGDITIPQSNIDLIKTLTDRGIVNSICSKNDYEKVKNKLTEYGLWEYFVFPKISWGAKGVAVKQIVDDIKLRPQTILFIDDNKTNLNEVEYFVPGINTSLPDIIPTLMDSPLCEGKDDRKHSRLMQYKVLEKKKSDELFFENNEDFLRQSGIQVTITSRAFLENEVRLWELNQRTNQLNFTKNRLTQKDFHRLLTNTNVHKGYVSVSDNYGDYGIVGFYALRDGALTDFYFSCRTIGLGVEQWVYAQLGFPQLNVVGEVATTLKQEACPDWINQTKHKQQIHKEVANQNGEILILGGCDLEQTAYYLEQAGLNFVSRFNYVVKGRYECHPDEMEAIRASVELTDEQKKLLLENCPFVDEGVFDSKLFDKKYNLVIYSPLIDFSQGIYQCKKDKSIVVSYGNYSFPDLVGHSYLPKEELSTFKEIFDFIGPITEDRLMENLEWLRHKLSPHTILVLLNGSTQKIEHPNEPKRHKFHEKMNAVISHFAEQHNNVHLIDVNTFISSKSDHTDSIRHYNRKIYFQIAKRILEYLHNCGMLRNELIIANQSVSISSFKVWIKTMLLRMGLLKFAYKVYEAAYKK